MEELKKTYRIAVIIGLAMMASVLGYAIIVGILEQGSVKLRGIPTLSGNQLDQVKYLLMGASLVIFFLVRFLPGRILGSGEPMQGGQGSSMQNPETGRKNMQRLLISAIVTYALCETPAIFGLILYLLGRVFSDFTFFLLISLFFFGIHFPRYSQWEQWLRGQRQE